MRKDFFDVPRTYYTTSYTKTQVPMFFYKVALRVINYFVFQLPAGDRGRL